MEFTPLYGTRFQSHYENTLSYDLVDKLGIVNSYETPKIEKIILSSSVSFKPQQVRGLAAGCLRLGTPPYQGSEAFSFIITKISNFDHICESHGPLKGHNLD
jgi:hypothetical protein